ncbi:hypothetical protein TNCV_419881 [Trichonephila clavipes]|uniref:Uncharacterized protein n=1 Tax=Trichonephila clavipes TaxID=2585209 RepID=A0A8X6VER9_TRICX|nr:hypothetical protein TNCV_419881 [Trichonephila clavipes]
MIPVFKQNVYKLAFSNSLFVCCRTWGRRRKSRETGEESASPYLSSQPSVPSSSHPSSSSHRWHQYPNSQLDGYEFVSRITRLPQSLIVVVSIPKGRKESCQSLKRVGPLDVRMSLSVAESTMQVTVRFILAQFHINLKGNTLGGG